MPNIKLNKFIKHPKKALLTLAFPVIIIMLAHTLYNIVDTAFVGRISSEAIAALTFAFPVFFIMLALNSGAASGMNSKIARFIGEKKIKSAENAAMHGLLLSMLISVIIFTVGIFTIKPLFILLGAEGTTLIMAVQYMTIVLSAVFFLSPAFILNNIFIAQGDTKTPMKIEITALMLNLILDYIFIFRFGWGVKGAAAATFASFAAYVVLGVYFIKTRSILKLKLKSFKFSKKITKEIIFVGFPASLMMLMLAIYFAFVNRFMAYFGVDYVAAAGIYMRIQSVATMPIVAVSIALLTLTGMFYGAKRYDLLKSMIMFAVKITVLFTIVAGAVLFIIPEAFTRIFTPNLEIIAITSAYLRIEIFSIPLIAISTLINRALQGMGTGIPGFVVNLARFAIIAIPLSFVFIFVFNYGYLSVAVASLIGAFVASIISFVWLEMKLKELNSS